MVRVEIGVMGCLNMAKRKNGEGSWGKKTIKGVVYSYYRDANGKYYYGKTDKIVKEKIKNAIDSQKTSSIVLDNHIIIAEAGVSDKSIFCDYMKMWLKTKSSSLSPATYDRYESAISEMEKFSKFNLADKQISSLTPTMIQSFLDCLSHDYSRSSINIFFSIIQQSINYGIANGDFRSNILYSVHVPKEMNCKIKKRKTNATTIEDVENIYHECWRKKDDGSYTLADSARVIVLIMYTGMRIGEALGLKWENVDWGNNKIHIKQSLAVIKNRDEKNGIYKTHRITKETKSKSGIRTLPLPDKAVDVLKYFEAKRKNDFVCVLPSGDIYNGHSIRAMLSRVLRNVGIPENKYTIHSLRHGYGSILLSKGIDIKVISELLGHSNVNFTYNVYIEIFEKDKEKVVDVLNNL